MKKKGRVEPNPEMRRGAIITLAGAGLIPSLDATRPDATYRGFSLASSHVVWVMSLRGPSQELEGLRGKHCRKGWEAGGGASVRSVGWSSGSTAMDALTIRHQSCISQHGPTLQSKSRRVQRPQRAVTDKQFNQAIFCVFRSSDLRYRTL
jgi:hypothetical protein